MTLVVRWSICCAVGFALAAPARAQDADADITRGSFAFFDRSLTVDVSGEAPGVLRVLRGVSGRINVVARAENGIASFTRGGWSRDQLRLTAVGADRVEYIVTVPEDVGLHLVLPDQPTPVAAASGSAATYRWTAGAQSGEDDARRGASPEPSASRSPAASGSFEGRRARAAAAAASPRANQRFAPTRGRRERRASEVYSAAVAPAEIVLPHLRSVRRLGLRLGGDHFRIEASRPLALSPGRTDRIEIHARGEPLDLVVHLPASARSFTLRAGAGIAAWLDHGTLIAPCEPVTRQLLPDGRQWVDYSPRNGSLRCRPTDLRLANR